MDRAELNVSEMYYDAMMDYLPWYDKNNTTFINFLKALNVSFLYIDEEGSKVARNLDLDTAVEMLDLYERRLDIKTDKSQSYKQRRDKIQAIINLMHLQTTKISVEKLIQAFANTDFDVKIGKTDEIDVLEINFVANNLTSSLKELWEILRKVMPAHLMFGVNLIFIKNLKMRTQYGDHVNPQYLCGEEKCGDIPWEIKADNKVFNLGIRTENYNSKNYYTLPSDDVPAGIEFEDLIDETIFIQDFTSKDIYEFKDKE